jgi:hypothetical protein
VVRGAPIAVDPVKPSDGRPIAVVEWEVPYEEIRPGRPIKLQVPPIQEDTVLYVLRVRVPEKLSLQQLEQLRKNWAHEVRKEISADAHAPGYLRGAVLPTEVCNHLGWILPRRHPARHGGRWSGQDPIHGRILPLRRGAGYLRGAALGIPTERSAHLATEHSYLVAGPGTRADSSSTAWGRIPSGCRTYYGTYTGGFFLYGTPQDTAGAGVDRTRYTGGYFLYALPQDTTKPAELVDYYVPNGTPQDTTEPASAARINIKPLADRVVVEPAPAEERQIAYNAGVEGAIIVERRGNVLVVGNFTPTHIALPMPELELDPGEGPVCGIPGSLGQGEETVGSTARQTANGPRGTRGFLIVAVMPSVAYSEREAVIPSVAYSEREKAFRMMPPGGGAPVLWPNGNPPRDPDWPWVGVIGTPVLEGIDGEPGPGKPQNWCGTEYIWTGPPPKSPKELILTPVIPRPR